MVHAVSPAHHRVYLLGNFRITRETQSIHLPTRKIESLLAYLILHPEVHTREVLATLFWGDSSNERAHGSLRKALALLRKSLGDEVIITDRETVQLNPDFSLWVDVREFERQARQCITESSPFNIDLYQGDLLSDLYDDWALSLREHYHELCIEVLLRIIETLRAKSEYKTAIDYAHKLLVSDPANERAHQHLMFCHITLGDRNRALQQYETCQRILRDELAVEPTRETQALYNWIKHSASDPSSLSARLTNLPIPISSFIGRGRELAVVKQLVAKARLVTLTGAGGSGKTRLAIHAATDMIDSFRDGVWWVELAPLSDPDLVPAAVAKALGISPQADQPLLETLAQFLRTRRILLILDNCEHLIDACAQVAEHLLLVCRELKVLCTSRETLSLTGENVWQVPTLSLPDVERPSLADLLMQYEGIQLFVERAGAMHPDFTLDDSNAIDVAQICQRLDGIPLAIELAAALVKMMSVGEIAAHLDDRFQLLTAENRTSQKRHQTLRAVLDWSYNLLGDAERLLFARLSVFSGGWTLDAAEAVCSGEGIERSAILNLLARLVDKSLVIITDGQRYGMLETMRQYGNEKLGEVGCQDWVVKQYLDYYLKMANVGDEKIRGPEQMEWLKWFEAERDNLSGAMEMAIGSPTTLETGCELVCTLCWYWGMVGDFTVMKYWLEIALPRSAELGKTSTRAKTLFNAAFHSALGFNWLTADEVRTSIEESLELWQALGSGFNIEIAKCLTTLGWIQGAETADRAGFANLEQAIQLFKESNKIWWQAWAFNLTIGLYLQEKRDHGFIQKALEEEVELWDRIGDRHNRASSILDLGRLALDQGDFLRAEAYLEQSLQTFREFGSKGYIFQCLESLGDTNRSLKKYEQAQACYQECIPLSHEILWDSALAQIYIKLGHIALHKGDAERAEACFQQAMEVCREFNLPYSRLLCVAGFASLAVNRKDFIRAAWLFGAFFAHLENLQPDLKSKGVEQMEIDGYLALCKSQLDAAAFEQAWNEGQTFTLEEALMKV